MQHLTNTGGEAGGVNADRDVTPARPTSTERPAHGDVEPAAAAPPDRNVPPKAGEPRTQLSEVTRHADSEPISAEIPDIEASDPELSPKLRARLQRLDAWRCSFLTTRPLVERLTLLHQFGITDHDLAAAIPNAKARAVKRWRVAGPPTTRKPIIERAVDDLYYTITYFLADGSLDETAIISWLRSRQLALYDRRPLDVLCADRFEDVRAAAQAVLSGSFRVTNEDLAQPPAPRPYVIGQVPPVPRE